MTHPSYRPSHMERVRLTMDAAVRSGRPLEIGTVHALTLDGESVHVRTPEGSYRVVAIRDLERPLRAA